MRNKFTLHRPLILFGIMVFLLACIRPMLPRIVFKPAAEITATPAAVGLPFDDVTFAASDGTKLNGWYVPAQNARGVLLFFHGNAGNISHRYRYLEKKALHG